MAISPARRAAFEILRRVEDTAAYSSVLLAALDEDLNAKDRALCHELVLGVLRRRLWLDRCIEQFGARRIEKVDPPVVVALRLGLYQLRFLTRVPPSAAVNEAVNLVRASKIKSAASFANAVLRRATREPDYDPATDTVEPIERVAIETSHPPWLIERWVTQIGFDEASALARANNDPSPLAFRFTTKAIAERRTERLLDELQAAGVELGASPIAPDGWRVIRSAEGSTSSASDGPVRLRALSDVGLIYFQDEGSQLVAHLVGAKKGERILDVCAAPGSKSTQIAALAGEAVIVAGDFYLHRARTIEELATQQQASNIETIVYDATSELPFTARLFDRVLVDAPCSGTGTLRHNPEIRWRLKSSDIADLSAKQVAMLANASEMVRSGGTLVYSTCSVEPEENEGVVGRFLEAHPDFESLALTAPAGLPPQKEVVRTWPHKHDVDGFFVAAFRRNN